MDDKQLALSGNEVQVQHDLLLEKVLDGGNIEVLERYIALKEREETRQAILEYERNFAIMQSEFEAVERKKKGHNYKYAPLEDLQEQYGPVISRHGFSYRWNEEKIDAGAKRCTMYVSGWGYTKENSFEIPLIDKTAQMNSVQAAGAMSTYGKRYTFLSGFGIIVKDEDTDGNLTFEDGIAYNEQVKAIRSCKSLEELSKTFTKAWNELEKPGRDVISKVKDEMKRKLK